ncbi:Fructose-1,6-bisphosphatase [Morus notabilis]|uniref:fructose-bisphosphatase n=1 Tax=Morus notabilis TaxID=981085 RepID=W9RHU9_9ROSA|nr:Fructose-1,6-bisphosphatase [Morus notabilis]
MDHSEEAYCRTDLMTITRHVLNEQNKHREACGDFAILLNHIVIGCKYVCSVVNKAGLAKLIGLAGNSNVQKKLDVLSNEVFVKALISSGCTCILVSEENEEAIFVEPSKRGRYIVVFDPLDGSSNIDCGVSVGTLVLSSGSGAMDSQLWRVHTNSSQYQEYAYTTIAQHEFYSEFYFGQIPKTGKIYSVNEGNARNWDEHTAEYVENCKFPHDGSLPKSLRYIGSMVADIHRTLLYGGIFMYPADKKSPNGKLRVLYKALHLVPKKIHERSPIFLGSHEDIEEIKELYAAFEDKNA